MRVKFPASWPTGYSQNYINREEKLFRFSCIEKNSKFYVETHARLLPDNAHVVGLDGMRYTQDMVQSTSVCHSLYFGESPLPECPKLSSNLDVVDDHCCAGGISSCGWGTRGGGRASLHMLTSFTIRHRWNMTLDPQYSDHDALAKYKVL